jgi:hypothetical protein
MKNERFRAARHVGFVCLSQSPTSLLLKCLHLFFDGTSKKIPVFAERLYGADGERSTHLEYSNLTSTLNPRFMILNSRLKRNPDQECGKYLLWNYLISKKAFRKGQNPPWVWLPDESFVGRLYNVTDCARPEDRCGACRKAQSTARNIHHRSPFNNAPPREITDSPAPCDMFRYAGTAAHRGSRAIVAGAGGEHIAARTWIHSFPLCKCREGCRLPLSESAMEAMPVCPRCSCRQ